MGLEPGLLGARGDGIASSSRAPRQWKATIAPLSSILTRLRRSSEVSASRPNSRILRAHSCSPGSSIASVQPVRSSSAPCEPR